MSKFVKGSLVSAGFLAALGFVLCLISAVFGGTSLLKVAKSEYMSGKFADFEDVVEVYTHRIENKGGSGADKFVVNGQNMDMTGWSAQEPVEGITELELVLGAGTFEVMEKDVADGMVDIYMQGTGDCDYYVKKGTFYMEGFKRNKISSNIGQNVVILEFPAGTYFKEVNAEIGAGRMEIDGLSIGGIEVEVGAGALEISNLEADELSLEVGAGTCEAYGVYAKNVSILADLGECHYEGAIEKGLDAECGMGNMEFILEGKESDHNYEIECSLGSVTLGGMEYSSLASERKIDNGAQGTFEIECNMGSVLLQFEDE